MNGELCIRSAKVSDAGRFRIVETLCAGNTVKLLVSEGEAIPSDGARLAFRPERTRIYRDGWLAGEEVRP